MSRCFPFPPPGYEKEPKPEDAGLLKEEKHKEKKRKKDKKDKEKREGKEKKEKDRSDRKHKEKKEKKDKHKDKKEKHRDKKDKNKDKEKERSSISEEARLAGHPGASSSDPGDKDEQNSGIFSVNKKYADDQRGQKPVQTSIPDGEIEESKFVQELGRRINDDEKGKGNHLAGSVGNFGECKRDEMMDRLGINGFGNFGDNTEKRVGNSVMGAQATWKRSVLSGNATAPNFSEASKSKVEGMPRRMEENNERNEEKEKPKRGDEKLGHKKEKEKTKVGDEKLGHKNKDNERDKKSQKKDKDREKEKEKAKEKNKHMNSEQDRFRNISKNDSIVVTNSKTLHVSGDNNDAALEGNIRKRKDFESNGFLHESEIRPAKLPRHIPHEITENGSKVEPPQIPHLNTSARQGGGSDIKVTEHKINGRIQGQLLSVSRPKPSPMVTGKCQIADASRKPPCSNEIAEASKKPPHPNQIDETSKKPAQPNQIKKTSKKPPHPDLKYLRQILSVPKMEEWNEYDEQEWLVGSKDSSGTKPKDIPNEEQRVWSEARYISPEIVARPYVIPY